MILACLHFLYCFDCKTLQILASSSSFDLTWVEQLPSHWVWGQVFSQWIPFFFLKKSMRICSFGPNLVIIRLRECQTLVSWLGLHFQHLHMERFRGDWCQKWNHCSHCSSCPHLSFFHPTHAQFSSWCWKSQDALFPFLFFPSHFSPFIILCPSSP